ncbi:Dabb family protein [Confluentibacter flavum]|uniref:Stress responsive protein n=1 Tax=Confluentibacter flavum TaxID=1909700 RepID=A0A2N3HMY0_9FLAO|nr:Dabb family protein [Confluentibacter flavum]PKQ46224.1 stress responsive protein [Confluentibacter flavum]
MKIKILLLLTVILISSCVDKKNDNDHKPEITPNTEEMTKKLRHVVLFKFKESSTPANIKGVETAFGKLPSEIKEIKDYEWGLNNSPEGLSKGFTHCFLVTFDSEEDRAIYLPHPAHKAFVDILSPHLEDVLVIDYWN